MRETDTDLAASRVYSQFNLKKREDIQPDVGNNQLNEFEQLSATEFMLSSKRERFPQRSDQRYTTNDNSNAYSRRNGEWFLNVEDRRKNEFPVPDYDQNENKQLQKLETREYNTNDYSMDFQEIKKSYTSEENKRKYESNWYD